MGKRSGRRGYFKRILYTYLAVLILPLIVLNVFVFNLVTRHARELDLKFTEEYVTRMQRDLEEEIYRMKLIALDIVDNLAIRPSVLEESPDNILAAQKYLSSYTVANQFITDVLYYPRDGTIFYGSNSVYSLETYAKYFLAAPGIGRYDVFKRINGTAEPRLLKWTDSVRGETLINFHYVYPLEKRTDRDACIVFLIAYPSMARLLGIDKTPPELPLFLTDQGGSLLFDYLPPGREEALEAFLNGRDDRYLRVDKTLDDPPWELTLLVDQDSFLPSVIRAFRLVLLISLSLILLEFLIIRLALKVTYDPLKDLASHLTPEEPVSDVLVSLTDGFHKLQSSRESVLNKLQREDFFSVLLHQTPSPDGDQLLFNKAAALGLKEDDGPLAAAIIDFDDQTMTGDSDLLDAYYESLTDGLPFSLIGWYDPLPGRFVCICGGDGRTREEMEALLAESCELLYEEFALMGRVTLGPVKSDFLHLKDSLDQAVLNSSPLSAEERKDLDIYQEKMESMARLLDDHDLGGALSQVDAIYEGAFQPFQKDFLTYTLFNLICRSLPEQSRDAWRRRHYPELENCLPREKRDYVVALMKESVEINRLDKRKSALTADLLVRLEAYLKANYLNPDFSVSRAAESLGVSLSSLSLLFKRHRGCGIAAWVGNARVDRAKVLLKEGLSVNDVVSAVGYRDSTSFIKKFKKQTGMTPGEYLGRINR